MIAFEWECRQCNSNYPCKRKFTGYPDIYPNSTDVTGCISPFYKQGYPDKSKWVLVKPACLR